MDYKDYVGEYVKITTVHRKHVSIKTGVLISTAGRYLLLSTHTSKGFIDIPKTSQHIKSIKVINEGI